MWLVKYHTAWPGLHRSSYRRVSRSRTWLWGCDCGQNSLTVRSAACGWPSLIFLILPIQPRFYYARFSNRLRRGVFFPYQVTIVLISIGIIIIFKFAVKVPENLRPPVKGKIRIRQWQETLSVSVIFLSCSKWQVRVLHQFTFLISYFIFLIFFSPVDLLAEAEERLIFSNPIVAVDREDENPSRVK